MENLGHELRWKDEFEGDLSGHIEACGCRMLIHDPFGNLPLSTGGNIVILAPRSSVYYHSGNSHGI